MSAAGAAPDPGSPVQPDPTTAADWPGADKFVAVQDMLDRNAVLINQINDNHSIRTPEALTRNVLLIKELNTNVQKIVELYQELADLLSCSGKPEDQGAAAATQQQAATG